MISKSLSKIISIFLTVFLLSSFFYPYSVRAQALDTLGSQSQDFIFSAPIAPSASPTRTSTGNPTVSNEPLRVFDYPTQNPSTISSDQIAALGSGTGAGKENCVAEVIQDSLIVNLGSILGDSLGSLGLDEILGDATGAVSGTFTNLLSGSLGGLTDSVGGALGGSLGGITDSIGGALGDSLGGLTDSLGSLTSLGGITDSISGLGDSPGGSTGSFGGGGAEVPTKDQTQRDIQTEIQSDTTEINVDTTNINADTKAQTAVEYGDGAVSLNSIAYCLANKTIEGILQGTLEWVNTGFNGNPVFIDDPEKFFGDIADYEAGQLLNELSGGLLCSHIDVKIRVNLANNYNNQKYNTYNKRKCTLSDIVDNVEGFANGDFSQGGWDSWIEYTQNPYNNYYGAQVAVQQELETRISNKQSATAWQQRNTDYLPITDSVTGEITTPGSMIESKVNERLNAPINRLTFASDFDQVMNSMINNFIDISIGDTINGAISDAVDSIF